MVEAIQDWHDKYRDILSWYIEDLVDGSRVVSWMGLDRF